MAKQYEGLTGTPISFTSTFDPMAPHTSATRVTTSLLGRRNARRERRIARSI